MRFVGFFLALPLDGGFLALLKLFLKALILALTHSPKLNLTSFTFHLTNKVANFLGSRQARSQH